MTKYKKMCEFCVFVLHHFLMGGRNYVNRKSISITCVGFDNKTCFLMYFDFVTSNSGTDFAYKNCLLKSKHRKCLHFYSCKINIFKTYSRFLSILMYRSCIEWLKLELKLELDDQD